MQNKCSLCCLTTLVPGPFIFFSPEKSQEVTAHLKALCPYMEPPNLPPHSRYTQAARPCLMSLLLVRWRTPLHPLEPKSNISTFGTRKVPHQALCRNSPWDLSQEEGVSGKGGRGGGEGKGNRIWGSFTHHRERREERLWCGHGVELCRRWRVQGLRRWRGWEEHWCRWERRVQQLHSLGVRGRVGWGLTHKADGDSTGRPLEPWPGLTSGQLRSACCGLSRGCLRSWGAVPLGCLLWRCLTLIQELGASGQLWELRACGACCVLGVLGAALGIPFHVSGAWEGIEGAIKARAGAQRPAREF